MFLTTTELVAITAAYPILICWYDVSSVSPLMGYPFVSTWTLLVIIIMTLEWLFILRIQRGFILVFYIDFFALRHPVGGTLFHPHLPEINIFQLFCKDYSHYLLAHV